MAPKNRWRRWSVSVARFVAGLTLHIVSALGGLKKRTLLALAQLTDTLLFVSNVSDAPPEQPGA